MTLPALLLRARDSLADPRAGARYIMSLQVPGLVGWVAVALMAVASTLFAYLTLFISPPDTRAFFGEAMAIPLRTAFLQLFVWVVGTFALYRLGRARGGRGTLDDAIALVAWLQFVMLVLQVVVLLAQFLVPPLAGFLALGEIAAFLWLLTGFTAELHGFRSMPATFVGVILGMLAMLLVLALILAPFVGPMGA